MEILHRAHVCVIAWFSKPRLYRYFNTLDISTARGAFLPDVWAEELKTSLPYRKPSGTRLLVEDQNMMTFLFVKTCSVPVETTLLRRKKCNFTHLAFRFYMRHAVFVFCGRIRMLKNKICCLFHIYQALVRLVFVQISYASPRCVCCSTADIIRICPNTTKVWFSSDFTELNISTYIMSFLGLRYV